MNPINSKAEQLLTGPWPARIATGILFMLFAWWSVASVLPFFSKDEAPDQPVKVKSAPAPAKASIKNLDLFGIAEISKPKDKSSEAKKTKLNLTLKGVLATEDPKLGIAQIQNANKEEKHFVVNDLIFGKATLEEVYMDRVIILRDGNYETLMLPEEFLNSKHFEASKLKQMRNKVATDYRNMLIKNDGMELIKYFGFKTKFRQGKFLGFVVTALGDKGREMMETLGVKDGDLVVAVNNLRFSEDLEATNQLRELKNATSINAIISRDGNEFPIHLELGEPIGKYGKIPEGKTEQDIVREKALAKPSFNETPEFQEYKAKQLERSTGKRDEVEFDH